MIQHQPKLRPEWVLGLTFLLFISGMSVLIPTCRGDIGTVGRGAAISKAAAPPPAAAQPKDTDGDDQPDHWNDPKYRREAALQMEIIVGVAALVAINAALIRRTQRSRRNA